MKLIKDALLLWRALTLLSAMLLAVLLLPLAVVSALWWFLK